MSNPQAFRATLHTISDALKTQSSGSTSKMMGPTTPKSPKLPSRRSTPLSPSHSHSHSRSMSMTTTSHSLAPSTTAMDSVPITPSPGIANINRGRTISHSAHARRSSGSPSRAPMRAQLVSIYDKPAWSGEPRQQSIVDLAASEMDAYEGPRGADKAGSRSTRHPMTVHIYDGPSCP